MSNYDCFLQGYYCVVALLIHDYGQDSIAQELMDECPVPVDKLKQTLSEFDLSYILPFIEKGNTLD